MSREKEKLKPVTIRVPENLYKEYKKVLLEEGKIVTYDIRRYIKEVVDNFNLKKGQN